ncbi:MAG: hypothetical protein HQ511_10565 [Rhodospirillales bacterium]|nr:hypothetical protein [Rhodospirillales bacterium]
MKKDLTRLFALVCALGLAFAPVTKGHATHDGNIDMSMSVQNAQGHGATADADTNAGIDLSGDGCSSTQSCTGGCNCAAPCGGAVLPMVTSGGEPLIRPDYRLEGLASGGTEPATLKRPPRPFHST